VRPLEAQHQGAVARALIEANADPSWSQERLETWIASEEPGWTEFVASCDPAISRIGWHNGIVAGLHVCRRVGEVGDVANVAVRREYRMRGLARTLMFHCLHAMREQGLKTARVYTGIGTDRNGAPSWPVPDVPRLWLSSRRLPQSLS
jgi:ribosomal protein S18 acetylase RimI-like enzyme